MSCLLQIDSGFVWRMALSLQVFFPEPLSNFTPHSCYNLNRQINFVINNIGLIKVLFILIEVSADQFQLGYLQTTMSSRASVELRIGK